jgi:type IV secretory pathway VirB3-like protein
MKILNSRRTLIAVVSMTYLLILGIVVKADVVSALVLISTSLTLGNAAEGVFNQASSKQKNKQDQE